jgi:hypothetical protein
VPCAHRNNGIPCVKLPPVKRPFAPGPPFLGKRPLLLTIIGLLLVLLGVGAFTQVTALSYGDLVAKLLNEGATVIEGGASRLDTSSAEASKPLLSGAGHLLMLNGERVEVYDYATTFLAAADAARISPDGTTFRAGLGPLGGSVASVERVAPPHFYARGRLIVQDIGTHQDVTAALARALGPQVAGGTP